MEELYSETYLKAKASPKRILARYGLIALCVVLVVLALGVLQSSLAFFFVIVIDVAIIVFLPAKDIAYEYVFVDGQIDFDMIIAGSKRKRQKRIDLDKVDLVAPEDSTALNNSKNVVLQDYSSGRSEDKHFIALFRGEKGLERIKFTPDEKLIENMKLKARSKIQC